MVKTVPCAKLECWVDPFSLPVTKALEQIGKHLQIQYETLSMRTRYKIYLDPSVEETKKFCTAQRRNAKDERVLFHYNGHGVPKPTQSGEIWVFNKTYTQYIPITLYDLQSWLGSPCLYVFDCSAAGNIISNFHRFADQRDAESLREERDDPNFTAGASQKECILLAACGATEILPMNPDLPADLFTCCLTSPIEIATRWFVLQNPLPSPLTLEMVTNIPGRLQDRRTALGELNWIFTAITDTIAWNVLPSALFKRLFRQDLMVAALFRNFLLAERIMRVHQCHPQSYPVLPSTYNHPMWDSWDLAVDTCLAQLPGLLEPGVDHQEKYVASSFFTEQLQAFEVWLNTASVGRKAPDQLPIVLQVLLSQAHRLKALVLLSQFLDLGPWAVNLALSIGIFPYVLKLLQSPAAELKPVLIFIWARILAVDNSCQTDLMKATEYNYFVQILLNPDDFLATTQKLEHKAMASFILAVFVKDFRQGQVALLSSQGLMSSVLEKAHFEKDPAILGPQGDPQLRQWSLLLISCLWKNFAEAKWHGVREKAPEKIVQALSDVIAEVRAAALVALTTFIGLDFSDEVVALETYMAVASLSLNVDGSPLVRKELVVFFSHFIVRYEKKFIVAAYELLREEYSAFLGEDPPSNTTTSREPVFSAIWKTLLMFSVDPFLDVEQMANAVLESMAKTLVASPLADSVRFMLNAMYIPDQPMPLVPRTSTTKPVDDLRRITGTPAPDQAKGTALRNTIKRSASIAVSLKNFALGHHDPPEEYHPEPNQPPPQEPTYIPSVPQAPLNRPLPRSVGTTSSLVMPLKSTYLAWATEYFTEPQMKRDECEEPGSIDYNERLWRRTRNENIIATTQEQKVLASSQSWAHTKGVFDNVSQPTNLLFHQFEPHLIAADDRDGITVWDWEAGKRITSFSNANPVQSKITELKLINEDDKALLMTGSSEGIVRIYRDYETADVQMVTSWRALSDLLPSNRASGLVADWQQGCGHLLVGGDVKVIRVFDAERELSINDIPARSGSCITSLTSDQVAGQIFAAGFGDGAVRVYDKRLPSRDAMIKLWKDHRAWITDIHMQRGGTRELLSGCVTGEVKRWDLRSPVPVASIQAAGNRTTQGGLRRLAVHEHAPCFATGSGRHTMKVWNMSGALLSSSSSSSTSSFAASHHFSSHLNPSPAPSAISSVNVGRGVNSAGGGGRGSGAGASAMRTLNTSAPSTAIATTTATQPVPSQTYAPTYSHTTTTSPSTFTSTSASASASVSALAFHPHKMVIGSSGGGDSRITLHSPLP